jgi:hypothetical protein
LKYKEPWKVGNIWKSEAAFWTWVRGGLRKLWSKHPIKLEYIKQYRKQIQNPNPNGKKDTVWGMTCSCCKKDVVQSNIQIDHISDTGGKFTGLDDIKEYAAYLFLIDFSCIRAVCLDCHAIINLSQKLGISFEEAAIEKRVIAFMKQPVKKQLAYFQELGYNTEIVSNAAKRRKLIKEIFLKEVV